MRDFNPDDYRGEFDSVHCPSCARVHPRGYELTTCAHPNCEFAGCHKCFQECECSASCGWFCPEHLSEISIPGTTRPLLACARCESEAMDDEPAEIDCAANDAALKRIKQLMADIEARKITRHEVYECLQPVSIDVIKGDTND